MELELWWFKILLLISFLQYAQQTCLTIDDAKVQKRTFYIAEQELAVQIEMSDRTGHQLISHIFQILITEVVGYQNVSLVYPECPLFHPLKSKRTMKEISKCALHYNKSETCVPDVMINLETWLEPGFNIIDHVETGEIEDAGSLGLTGEYGWFVSEYTSRELYNITGKIIENYRTFQNDSLAKHFNLEDLPLDSFTIDKLKNSYCSSKCNYSIYVPERCQNPTVRCATLLAGYPVSCNLLIRHIENLKLFVTVAWVKDNLKGLLLDLFRKKRRVIFFHDKPSLITNIDSRKFIPIAFPQCDFVKENDCIFEKYNVFQLEKVAWSKIKTQAPLIFHVLRSMTWTPAMYIELLQKYEAGFLRGHDLETIACDWIQENRIVTEKWIPDSVSAKTTLYIGGIFPVKSNHHNQSGVIPAAQMAIKAVNENTTILTQYNLQLLELDGQCETDKVMRSFITYLTNSSYHTMVGILGPACTKTIEPVAGVAESSYTMIISYSAEGVISSDSKKKYPYFFRTIPLNNLFRHVYLKIFDNLEWRRIGALTEDGFESYSNYITELAELSENRGIKFIKKSFHRERNLKRSLEDLKEANARIIIGEFYEQTARMVMCTAFKLNMTPRHGYQWFLPLWYTQNWFDTTQYNAATNDASDQVSCSTEDMIQAINGYISLAYKHLADETEIMQEKKCVANWTSLYRKILQGQGLEESHYAGYAYDAVWVYALAVDELLKENNSHNSYLSTLHTEKTANRLAEIISKVKFNGVSGSLQFTNSSRLSDILIRQWLNKDKREVGIYRPFSYEDGNFQLNESQIVWLTQNRQKPSDGIQDVYCDVERFRKLLNISNCEKARSTIYIISITFLVVVTVLTVYLFKKRYDRRIKKSEDKIKELFPEFKLDDWEMPRDHIVINRKLGEGAFGTVYGGEAKIQNRGWIDVAVKTLKDGAKSDERLDFLSEAEIMKKFDHMNIVKLIGVCTMGKPVYTIMEFALYGDLKTFLLGRRNLITEATKCEEISNRKLTNMALDVARGLSYLANLKYVHRDLACRNCLVIACRTVKIGDFGMCRRMYDSDYYRFTKRGMLPVRWMAPESLTDGIFTPMSDVWSYGVLLYEIITFGSFPYQGMSNNQVLDYVKKQNTLQVPKGCKNELELLLKRCWSKVPQDRLQAAEIVEVFASYPDLISPCVGMPAASIEVQGSDSEFQILENGHAMPAWTHRRHLSAPDTAIGNMEIPEIITDTGIETPFCAAARTKSPFVKSKSARQYQSQKRNKKEEKVKFQDEIPSNLYHVTHL